MLRLKRPIGIRFIGVALAVAAAILVARQQHTAADKYEAVREERCVGSFPGDPQKQDACKHERDRSDDYLPWWHVLVAWPEGITTWAILLTLLVVSKQTGDTSKAAEAGMVAARASLEQANHIVASERARLLLDAALLAKPVLLPYDSITGARTDIPAFCTGGLINDGNTPATVTHWEFELQIGDAGPTPPSVEIFKNQADSAVRSHFPIGPKRPGHFEARLIPGGFISVAEKAELDGKKKFLWLCGVARYRDVFRRDNEIHQTRICLFYESRMNSPEPYWTLGGTDEYNEAT